MKEPLSPTFSGSPVLEWPQPQSASNYQQSVQERHSSGLASPVDVTTAPRLSIHPQSMLQSPVSNQGSVNSGNSDTMNRLMQMVSLQTPSSVSLQSSVSPAWSVSNHGSSGSSSQVATALAHVSAELSQKQATVHRSITCNICKISPIRGIRFKCANCIDFDICETCEYQHATSVHPPTHLFLKIRIPIPPLSNPRAQLLNVIYPGNLSISENIKDGELFSVFKKLQDETDFDKTELEALFKQFRSLANTAEPVIGLDKRIFIQSLGPLAIFSNLIFDRMFLFFDLDRNDIIDFPEFCRAMSILSHGSKQQRVLHAFKGYDLNDDGYICRDELRQMLNAYFSLSMELVRDVVRSYEEENVQKFDETDGKPVSAMFSVPIPKLSSPVSPTASQGGYAGIMESLTQDAIEELVDKTFSVLKKLAGDDKISFPEFQAHVENDPSLFGWFESLGSVF